MRIRGSQSSSPTHLLEVDITSMIDIVFLLIVFFMVTAQFARLTQAELDLPQETGEQEDETDEAGLTINLDADGNIVMSTEDGPVSLEELEQALFTEMDAQQVGDASQLKVLLRADRNASTEQLNAVMNLLARTGVGAARLATEVPR